MGKSSVRLRSDELPELASFAFKSRAKRLVPGDDFVQRPPEHGLVERPVPAQRDTHVKRWIAARLQLIEQPKTPLRRSRGENKDARPASVAGESRFADRYPVRSA